MVIIVLLAVVDANYKFELENIGGYDSHSKPSNGIIFQQPNLNVSLPPDLPNTVHFQSYHLC